MKKILAILQTLALLWGLQAPAVHAQTTGIATLQTVPVNAGTAVAAVTVNSPATWNLFQPQFLGSDGALKTLTPRPQVSADRKAPAGGLSLPVSAIIPKTANSRGAPSVRDGSTAGTADNDLDDNTSALAGLLRHGVRAKETAETRGLNEAKTDSEVNFRLSAGLGRVGVSEGEPSAPEAGESGAEQIHAGTVAKESRERTLRLDNGMQVVLVRHPGLLGATITVGYAVGGRDEPAGESGYTHFVEHLMFQGTKHIRNWFRVIGAMGARANAYTSRDHTLYIQTVPADFVEPALSLEAERMANLEVTAAKVEREKRTILEEKAGRDDRPYLSGWNQLASLIFSNPRNRSDVIGSEQDILAATPEKLRRYLDAYYTPDRAKVVITGGIDLDETEKLVRHYLGSVPARVRTAPRPDLGERAQGHERYSELSDPHASAPAVLFGWMGPKYGTPAYYASDILTWMVQGRLYRKLILEGKRAMDVSLSLPYLERDPIAIQGSIALGPRLSSEDALSALEAEIAAIESGDFKPEELSNAVRRQFLWAQTQLDSSDNAMLLALAAVRGLSAADLQEDIARWTRVTADEVRRAARLLSKDKRSAVLVRPDPRPKAAKGGRVHDRSPAVEETPTPEEERLLSLIAEEWSPKLDVNPPAEFTLANGLKVIVMPDSRESTVWAKLAFRLGVTAGDAGARRRVPLAARLLSMRTRLSAETDIQDRLLRMNGTLRVDRMWDHVVFHGNAPDTQAFPLLELLAELVSSPRAWTAEELAPWKGWFKESMKQSLSDPDVMSQKRAVQDLLGTHPSAQTDPTPEAIDAMTPEEFSRLIRLHFTPDNAVLALAGNVDPQRARETLNTLFQQWRPSDHPPFGPGPDAAVRPQASLSLLDRPGSEQSHIRLSAIGLDAGRQSSPDFFPLMVANRILGDGFGSRLFQTVRQSLGYAYDAFSAVITDPALAMWTFGLSTRPEKTGPALQALLEQARRMREEAPSAIELGSAKNGLIASFLLSLDHIGDIADHLLGLELFGLPLNELGLYPARVSQVTGEAVLRIAGKLLDPRRMAVTVVGEADMIREDLSRIRPIQEYDRNGRPKASGWGWLSLLKR